MMTESDRSAGGGSSKGLLSLPFVLRGISIRSGALWMAPDFDPFIPNQNLFPMARSTQTSVDRRTAKVTEGDELQKVIRSCTFRITYEFAYTKGEAQSDEEIEKNMVARVMAELAVDYLVTAEEFPDLSALEIWAQRHAMAHSWPYWREYCHSAQMRMNLPVTMMPLLNLQPGDKRQSTDSVAAQPAPKKPRKRTPKKDGAAA